MANPEGPWSSWSLGWGNSKARGAPDDGDNNGPGQG